MEIPEIKQRLSILSVLSHYGLKLGKGNMLCCPFHEDKTPSMQIYPKTNSWCCFSGNCKAGTGDVIQFIELMENGGKPASREGRHEAIVKAKALLGLPPARDGVAQPTVTNKEPFSPTYNRTTVLEKVFSYFEVALLNSKPAKTYLQNRGLDKLLTLENYRIGYHTGSFHLGSQNNKELIQSYVSLGLLRQAGTIYQSFGLGALVFPLLNKEDKITGLYFRMVEPPPKKLQRKNHQKHLYLKDRQGLYPKYPDQKTKSIILTESVIDAATLLQQETITKEYCVLALYGTNGLTAEHTEAVSQLKHLQEITLWLDGDQAGRKATEKYGKLLKDTFPHIKITEVEPPEGEDINSLLEGHQEGIHLHLLKERKVYGETSVNENIIPKKETEEPKTQHDFTNPHNLVYTTTNATYKIKGGIGKNGLDSLRVTLEIIPKAGILKSRNKVDLYEDKQTEKLAEEAGEKLNIPPTAIFADLQRFTDLLDEYRNQKITTAPPPKPEVPITEKTSCLDFLKQRGLIPSINRLIGKAGVVGEENNRIFLFVIASSYKMADTLQALIQGSSGSGKTHLLATIMDFMPPEDTISLTRVTESSFYNYGEYELQNKLIGIEDYDGLEEKAELAFRELQSKGMISSSTSGKNEKTGEISGYVKKVYGPIASLSATTQAEIYEDNMSRCFLVAVDESAEQTQRIIEHQNRQAAGGINKKEGKKLREFLRNCIRLLAPYEVINPYASKITLPQEAQKIRRLNNLFQSFIKQITILNQYQRQRTTAGELIAEKEDVATAINIMFDSIFLKVDELDGSLRLFYEKLKTYILPKGKDHEFTQREVRHQFLMSQSSVYRYVEKLLNLEYLTKTGAGKSNTHHYKIQYWDNLEQLRERIKAGLKNQLEKL